jgi:hypothetical protein
MRRGGFQDIGEQQHPEKQTRLDEIHLYKSKESFRGSLIVRPSFIDHAILYL